MEFAKVKGRWAIAAAALAALVTATAWQPAAAQDKPAAQEPPAKKADKPAEPKKAKKVEPKKDDNTVVVPGKKAVVNPPTRTSGPKVRRPAQTPEPTVKLKAGEVPGIKFDTPVFNFGRVPSGTEIKHDFWFTNTGTGPLEIIRAKPS